MADSYNKIRLIRNLQCQSTSGTIHNQSHLGLRWGIFREVLMRVSILDRLARIALCEGFAGRLTIHVVISTGILCEMARFMDEGSTFGVCSSGGCAPEGAAEIYDSESIIYQYSRRNMVSTQTYSSG